MSQIFAVATATIIILLFITVVGTTLQKYEESENVCKNIGMELHGWVPGGASLTCRGLENEQVILIKFQRVNEKYYTVKEVN